MTGIRRATREDIDELTDLFDLYRVFYHQPSDMAAAKKFLLQRMEKEESVIFVAVEEKSLLGFTQLYPLFSSVSLQKTWVLNDLYVCAPARTKGIAAQLLDAARQYGMQTDAKSLLLQTSANNFTAQSVYEKNGWKRVSDYFYELLLAAE